MIQIILALLLKWNIFWWIMQCQPSPRRTHLNKCRFEMLKDEASVSEWFTTPCKCWVISSCSLSKNVLWNLKKKKHSKKNDGESEMLPCFNFFFFNASCHRAYYGLLCSSDGVIIGMAILFVSIRSCGYCTNSPQWTKFLFRAFASRQREF